MSPSGYSGGSPGGYPGGGMRPGMSSGSPGLTGPGGVMVEPTTPITLKVKDATVLLT
jgi:hypothetical protein